MYKTSVFVFVCFLLTGCNGLNGPEGKTSSASYIGDRASVSLDEVVVTVPIAGRLDQYQNLHVFFAAIINSEKPVFWNRYEVEGIVRRSSTRLSSLIVQELCKYGGAGVSARDLSSIRKQLASKAQQAFDSAFSKWSHSEQFEVEIVIVSLFLTDASVGKTPRSRRFWLD